MKIIASLTTMPNRIDKIKNVLDCISNQNIRIDRIEMNIPCICIRTGETYIIPEWLKVYPKLEIFQTEDYGPITKIAPTLLRYKNQTDVYIWSVDDDIRYPPDTLEGLVNNITNEKRILSRVVSKISWKGIQTFYRPGTKIENKGIPILEGFGSLVYPANCIEDDFLEYVVETVKNSDCRVSDDLLLTNYFYKLKIQIVFCGSLRLANFLLRHSEDYFNDTTATHKQDGGHSLRYIRVMKHLQMLNMLYFNTNLLSIINVEFYR